MALNQIGFLYPFDNEDLWVKPIYSSCLKYDKLLPVNAPVSESDGDPICPPLQYGWPNPVVPVRVILLCIDKLYGTEFAKWSKHITTSELTLPVTDEFGQSEEVNIERDLCHVDGYTENMFGDKVSFVPRNVTDFWYQISQKFYEYLSDKRWSPIYDLGVIPCATNQIKIKNTSSIKVWEVNYIDGDNTYNFGEGNTTLKNPIYIEGYNGVAPDGTTTTFDNEYFEINNGIIIVKQPNLRFKIRGTICCVAQNVDDSSPILKEDFSSVSIKLKYVYEKIDGSDEICSSEKPVSLKKWSVGVPFLVGSDDSIDIHIVQPHGLFSDERYAKPVYKHRYSFCFLFGTDGHEDFNTESGYAKTDINGFWACPALSGIYKVISKDMYNPSVFPKHGKIYLSLDYDEEVFKNVNVTFADITIEPYFENGGIAHKMSPIHSLPQMSCYDFLKGLLITEGSYFYLNDGKLEKKRMVSLLDNIKTSNAYDILPIGSIEISNSNNLAQKNVFKSASDEKPTNDEQEDENEKEYSEEGYANNLYICTIDNKYIPETNVISENPFYPPYIKDVSHETFDTGGGVKAWEVQDVLTTNQEKYAAELEGTEAMPTIGTLGLTREEDFADVILEGNYYYRFTKAHNEVFRINMQEIPTFRFKNNPNYKMLKRIIELGIAIKCKCVLPIEDTFDIDWTKPVYIDRLNSYFLLVSVSWSSTDNVSELEMLKIPADIIIEDNENE